MFRQLIENISALISRIFKKCPMCSEKWQTREEFLSDPDLKVTGYMANFDRLELGIFLLDHMVCGTTLAIQASQFTDLYDGPVFSERQTGTDVCPGYCLDKGELRPCDQECECAYVRQVLQKIMSWHKAWQRNSRNRFFLCNPIHRLDWKKTPPPVGSF